MTLNEIKTAVREGKKVHWMNPMYDVINPIKSPTHDAEYEQWLIICNINGNCVGLTHSDNITLSEHESQFFIA